MLRILAAFVLPFFLWVAFVSIPFFFFAIRDRHESSVLALAGLIMLTILSMIVCLSLVIGVDLYDSLPVQAGPGEKHVSDEEPKLDTSPKMKTSSIFLLVRGVFFCILLFIVSVLIYSSPPPLQPLIDSDQIKRHKIDTRTYW